MRTLLLVAILIPLFTISGFGQQGLRQKNFNLKNGLALSGYDAVSYFDKKPVKGSSQFSYQWQGVTYYFKNDENRNKFKQNPGAYEPQYGGWCAYAMGNAGEKVEVDPETYKIIDGKLYLFYNALFNNTLKTWNKDEKHLKENADANWAKIYK